MIKYVYTYLTSVDKKNEDFLDAEQVIDCVKVFYKESKEIPSDEQIKTNVDNIRPDISVNKYLSYQEMTQLLRQLDLIKHAKEVSNEAHIGASSKYCCTCESS